VAERLEKWFCLYGRAFPWRRLRDPFIVFVVEMLLQRTRAETVEKVYEFIVQHLSSPTKLAEASEEELNRVFSHLGLTYRARRLKEFVTEIIEKYGGMIPCDMDSLLRLKGVGVYIASAVLNFGCDVPTAVVDKNVLRVLNSLVGITTESAARMFIAQLYRYGDHRKVAYALIDLGALVCKKNARKCNICPLTDLCGKHELRESSWRVLRKAMTGDGRIILREQPLSRVHS
jgi:A/G-specific adenine glycosylase